MATPPPLRSWCNERSGEIYGLLYRLTENGEEARDLTQETFLRAFQSIAHFRGESDLRTWIYRIAINQARNRWRWWRRRRREATVSIDAPEIGGGRLAWSRHSNPQRAKDPEQDALAQRTRAGFEKSVEQFATSLSRSGGFEGY